MASTASLLTKRRRYAPVAHYIWWAVRRYSWMALLSGGVYAYLVLFVNFGTGVGADNVFSLLQFESIEPLRWSVVLFGLVTAFLLFGYLWKRRETNCYGVLGISRSKQFLIRYLLGFVCNILPIVVVLLVAYRQDLAPITTDAGGLCAHYTLGFILSLCLISWLAYTLCVVVAILCGRLLSAGICAAGVLAAPYAVMLAAQSLMNIFLLGAPGGSMIYQGDIPWLNFMANVGKKPGLFTMFEEDTFRRLYIFGHELTDVAWAEQYKKEHALPMVKFLLLAGLALALFALAWWLFTRRRAERAGQLYINPVLSHTISLTIAVLTGALLMRVTLPVERTAVLWLKGFIFLGAVVVVSLLVRLLLTREMRGLVRGLPVAGGAAAVVLAVIICLSIGCFGYSTYIPETDEIASVQVTYNQNKTPYIECRAGSSGGVWKGETEIEGVPLDYYREHYYSAFDIRWTAAPVLTTSEDIEIVRGIHKTIIEDGLRPRTGCEAQAYADSSVTVHYCISYTLKSGEVVNRYYENLSLRSLEATLQIDNTSFIQEKMQTLHANGFFDPGQKVIISDELFRNSTVLGLSDEEKLALFAAIDADYAGLSIEQRYFPAADVLGVIYLSTVFENELGGDSNQTETVPMRADLNSDLYYITTAYTRTLAFLEEHDLMKYMTASYAVKAILVQDYTPRHQGNRAMTYQFCSVPNLNQLDGEHVETVTRLPASDLETVMDASVPTAMLTRPGRLILIVFDDGIAVVRFVPEA